MSTYVDATAGAVEHCELMAQQHPDLAETYYDKIANFCKSKLWHQLTLTVLDLVSQPSTTLRTTPEGTNSYLALYDKVMMCIDTKVNSLSLARIAVQVANSLTTPSSSSSCSDVDQQRDSTAAKAILENLLAKSSDALPAPARIYVQSKLSLLTLNSILAETTSDARKKTPDQRSKQEQQLAPIKTIMSSNLQVLKEMIAVPDKSESAIVHSAHYEMSMTYYKVLGPPEAFYDQAMSYLNYTPLVEGSGENPKFHQELLDHPKVYQQLAVDLCLAALTGEGVYNLGQVVIVPFLTILQGTSDAWLYHLLQSCVKANVVEFKKLTEQYASAIAEQPALVHRAAAVQEKLTLLALVNLVFEKASSERVLSFQEIAERLHIALDQVEWLVMRALSVHLIEGSLDQVDQTVSVTWVMPRVLDPAQLQALATRYGEWAVKVSNIKERMQEQTPTFA